MYILIPRRTNTAKNMQRDILWDAINKLKWNPKKGSGNVQEGKILETEK